MPAGFKGTVMNPIAGRNPCVSLPFLPSFFGLGRIVDRSCGGSEGATRTLMLIASWNLSLQFFVDFHIFSPYHRCRFGEIPGFPVGSRWSGRRELCDAGVHAHLSGGIHGRGQEGAFSIVLCVSFSTADSHRNRNCASNDVPSPLNRSGGYEDDVDMGHEL